MEESWDQIGVRLKHAREKAEMTVDDVVFKARIPRSVVEALEAEDFSVFTSPTYAKSFLRQYSEFLEVDAEPWLNALEPAAYVGGNGIPMFGGTETPAGMKRTPSESRSHKIVPDEETASGNRWSAAWVMFLTAALVVSVIKGYQTFEEKFGGESGGAKEMAESPTATPVPSSEVSAQPVAEAPAAPVSQVPAAEEPKTPPPVEPPPRAVIIRE